MLAITAFYYYEFWQMDVKTDFLIGNLTKDMYMVQLKGFVDPKKANMVCKLKRSSYGLKQASRSWNIWFDVVVKSFGLLQNFEETCVYKKESGRAQ